MPAGIDRGGNIGAARSVDIDVTDTGGENCPDTWTIGARLTPVYGQAAGQNRSLPVNGEWTPTDCVATLPEPGVYLVTAMAVGQICAIARYSTNVWISFGLQRDDDTVLTAYGVVQHQYGFPAAGNGYQACHVGQGSLTRNVVVGDRATLRVVAAAYGRVAENSTVQRAEVRAPRISWHKISDQGDTENADERRKRHRRGTVARSSRTLLRQGGRGRPGRVQPARRRRVPGAGVRGDGRGDVPGEPAGTEPTGPAWSTSPTGKEGSPPHEVLVREDPARQRRTPAVPPPSGAGSVTDQVRDPAPLTRHSVTVTPRGCPRTSRR
ncbi:hypothetical protein GTW38_33525 [Streptomyces sp. SID7804]|uniref:hypothetical protein n=1 Tax=Streptomyces TaxID=1883 RepID=UPI001367C4FE|nr:MULTISPECIES: hypothetical protein [Streptomyces]MBA8978418.1 hypothetical protein [Streptomyces calvus]MYS31748.1 hypothetical protein [Streptomyces sp. SID7804]